MAQVPTRGVFVCVVDEHGPFDYAPRLSYA